MKKNLLFILSMLLTISVVTAQVTQINSNKGLHVATPLNNNKVILVSDVDQTIWVSDATAGGTFQLSTIIGHEGNGAVINGKYVFEGNTLATGPELFVTDGTIAGTKLLLDIFPGITGSTPDNELAILNGFIYFTAIRPLDGRELWRTDGTSAGTTLVKDVVPGTTGSNDPDQYHLFSNGNYLLFAARTAQQGVELWRSDGTSTGTILLKDIFENGVSSNPTGFYSFGNLVLFQAQDQAHGTETWKTDGTIAGTVLLKDINPGTASSSPLFGSILFYVFNNKAYFTANDGTHGAEVWNTDGTTANTTLLKDIEPGAAGSYDLLVNAVKVGNKFIFPSTDFFTLRYQLWESDGTPANTKLFMSFDGGNIPFNLPSFDINGQNLYNGKFFFVGSTAAGGSELWASDGTIAGTAQVKDINPGTNDGVMIGTYIYTTAGIYFAADNGITGTELWKSDGTTVGTVPVADLNTGAGGSDPVIFSLLVNNQIMFSADNGDDIYSDLYVVNGVFTPLPVKLADFTVQLKSSDALLQWNTEQEINSRDFTIEKSFNGTDFNAIGTVVAAGNSSVKKTYGFTDPGVANSGNNIVHYRLRSNDKDGKSTLSPVITLRLKGSNALLAKILTNPVADQLRVVLSGVKESVQLSVLDMSGKKAAITATASANGQVTFNTANLPGGNYILVALSGDERQVIQFVK